MGAWPPRKSLSHEEADDLAQRTLGEMEPYPGEGPGEYARRMDEMTTAFAAEHPNWRRGVAYRPRGNRIAELPERHEVHFPAGATLPPWDAYREFEVVGPANWLGRSKCERVRYTYPNDLPYVYVQVLETWKSKTGRGYVGFEKLLESAGNLAYDMPVVS